VESYWEWVASLSAVPVVSAFRGRMDELRERELNELLRRVGALEPQQREAIEYFSRALMNKFLHEPSVRLRAAAANGRGLGIVDAARYLFALDAPASSSEAEGRSGTAPSDVAGNSERADPTAAPIAAPTAAPQSAPAPAASHDSNEGLT
jgi:glutamyl-tRNA reductase